MPENFLTVPFPISSFSFLAGDTRWLRGETPKSPKAAPDTEPLMSANVEKSLPGIADVSAAAWSGGEVENRCSEMRTIASNTGSAGTSSDSETAEAP